MSDREKMLAVISAMRGTAAEIAKADINGFGNAVSAQADDLEALLNEHEALKGRLAGLSAKWRDVAAYQRGKGDALVNRMMADDFDRCAVDLDAVIGTNASPTAPEPERP